MHDEELFGGGPDARATFLPLALKAGPLTGHAAICQLSRSTGAGSLHFPTQRSFRSLRRWRPCARPPLCRLVGSAQVWFQC